MTDGVESAQRAKPQANARPRRVDWRFVIGIAAWMALLFGAGFAFSAFRNQPFSFARATSAPADLAPAAPYGVTLTDIERLPWREAAAKIGEANATRINADAERGEALAQSAACLAHMAGVGGFLPSPAAAKSFCDAASAQNYPAGLYLSWALYRSAPHAGLTDSEARTRLQEAARRGLAAAEIDYALLIAPDARGSTEAQVEAGRLLQAAAEQGDARGQLYYARWLRDSPAGPRDPSAAAPYLERASETQAEAAHMLATLYRDGTGVERNRARALELYERAADKNYPPSMFNMADLLRETNRDAARALYARLACMSDEREISAMASARLRAMGETAQCS